MITVRAKMAVGNEGEGGAMAKNWSLISLIALWVSFFEEKKMQDWRGRESGRRNPPPPPQKKTPPTKVGADTKSVAGSCYK